MHSSRVGEPNPAKRRAQLGGCSVRAVGEITPHHPWSRVLSVSPAAPLDPAEPGGESQESQISPCPTASSQSRRLLRRDRMFPVGCAECPGGGTCGLRLHSGLGPVPPSWVPSWGCCWPGDRHPWEGNPYSTVNTRILHGSFEFSPLWMRRDADGAADRLG